MRVFIAGATGALGFPLVERLLRDGHEVVGLTRSEQNAAALRRAGAEAVVGDALDGARLRQLVVAARPTHVVHLLTALPKQGAMRAKELEPTNVLRIRGTAHLIDAALAAGARRIVAESFPLVYGAADFGETPIGEDTPFAPAEGATRNTVEALRSLESQLLAVRDRLEVVILRYGFFYGPDVPSTRVLLDGLRGRKVPLVRGDAGLMSWIHIDDAAAATVAALESPATGIYNVVDDEPVSMRDFTLRAAEALSAPRPWTVPRFVARLVAPLLAEATTKRLPLSNARAKRELGFTPRFGTYREGLIRAVSAASPSPGCTAAPPSPPGYRGAR